ncbi:MAG: hypothetical protein HY594_02400 [Candidatus Omnitrophica bacterium]|nr:hypothetical protein [Candidatus Omnitrophota bacterium]
MTDLTQAVKALADLGVHPIGLTVDGPLIALRLSPQDQAAILKNPQQRDRIVECLRELGFMHVTVHLDDQKREEDHEAHVP